MIVVAFKFFVLIAVLWWYSITIFGVINDYFRKEFNEYLKHVPAADSRRSDTVHTQLPESLRPNRIESKVDVLQQPLLPVFVDSEQSNQNDNMHVVGNKQEFNLIPVKSVGTCLSCTRFNYWQEIVWNVIAFDNVCLMDTCIFL